MSHAESVKVRYESALKQNSIPSRIALPNTHFVSNVLPGRTSSMTKRLKQLQKMYTANEFSYFTKNFKDRQLNLRTCLPTVGGRGVLKRNKNRKKKTTTTTTRRKRRQNNVV